MANSLTTQTIISGPRNYVVHVFITGDGSGDYTNQSLITVSGLSGNGLSSAPVAVRLEQYTADLSNFSANLSWDASTPVPFVDFINGLSIGDYTDISGIPNNSGAGKTGNVVISTKGLDATGKGHLTLEWIKTY